MAERLNATVLKTVEGATPPWVRIPLSPPVYISFFYAFDPYEKTSWIQKDAAHSCASRGSDGIYCLCSGIATAIQL